MKPRDFRIVLFAAIVATILFSGVCTSEYYARPLLDEYITLTTTANPTSYSTVGEQITYSFLISNISPNFNENDGPGAFDEENFIENIVIIDSLADNPSCPRDYLWAGESTTCTDIYTITQEDIDRGEVINQASLSGMREIPGALNCCAPSGRDDSTYKPVYANTDYTIILAKPEIHLEKTGSPNVFRGAGEQITYTYSITNTGTIALEGPISVQDNLVAVTCPAGGLGIGARVECTALYTTTEDDVTRGVIINTALASVGSTNSLEATFQIGHDASAQTELDSSAELSLSKSTDPTTHSYKGELMIFIFDVTNTGSVPLTSPFTINDPKLDELICTPPEQLSVGGTFECRGYYRVREFDIGKTISNCASVSGTYQGQSISSEEACAYIPYEAGGQPPPAPDSDPEPDTDPDND